MRLVIQRVTHASVTVDQEVIGKIEKGFLVLMGVGASDDEAMADKYLKKMLGLRIFEDENGKTNLSLKEVGGELLMVSRGLGDVYKRQSFFWCLSLRSMPIAGMETVPDLHRQVRRITRRSSMNICLHAAGRLFLLWSMENSEPI